MSNGLSRMYSSAASGFLMGSLIGALWQMPWLGLFLTGVLTALTFAAGSVLRSAMRAHKRRKAWWAARETQHPHLRVYDRG